MCWDGATQELQTTCHVHNGFPTGESNTVVSPTVPGGLSDGQWHTVHLRYYNKVGTTSGTVWLGSAGESGF